MKNKTKFGLILLATILFITIATQTARAANTKINAGMLPSLWYSSLNISKDDQIKIYGGMQNHSDTSFSFTAVMYIDGTSTASLNFVSNPNSLIEISYPWTAVAGTHTAQLKITDVVFLGGSANDMNADSLLSLESNNVSITISQKISFEEVKSNTSKLAVEILNSIDAVANNLADNVETLKKPISSENNSVAGLISSGDQSSNTNNVSAEENAVSNNKILNQVKNSNNQQIGNELQIASVLSSIQDNNFLISIYNKIIDFISLIIRNWKISLSVIIIFLIIVKFMYY